MKDNIEFTTPDEPQWQELDQLASRSYGHRVEDLTLLRDHATARVAVRNDGRVIAGGIGLLVPQYLGGRPVPSACLAAGHVAPEIRGDRLAARLVADRVHGLQNQGDVISCVWTKASSYGRHLGWEAVTPVLAWSVATDELKRTFGTGGLDITEGLTAPARSLHDRLAAPWDGPVQRPAWWWDWETQASTT